MALLPHHAARVGRIGARSTRSRGLRSQGARFGTGIQAKENNLSSARAKCVGRQQAVRGSGNRRNQPERQGSRASPSDQLEGGSLAGFRYSGNTPLTDLKTVVLKDFEFSNRLVTSRQE